jgi:gluconate:H+ symporter, GntP family
MSHMPLLQALLFLASVVVLIALAQWRRFHPFLAIVIGASAFGLAAGFSVGFLGKAFGSGFSQAIYSPGLVIVAAGFVAAIADTTAASDWLMAKVDHWRWQGSTRIAALLGLIAGTGASPAAAFALLTPLLRALAGETARSREATSAASALAISASHGLVLFSPIPIAAASILGAPWARVALFGLPVAVVVVLAGAAWTRWLCGAGAAALPTKEQRLASRRRGGWSALVLLAATALPLLLLMIASLGDIPSEPLGGGSDRELVLGVGRPLILFLVGVGVMLIGHWRFGFKFLADHAWTARILGNVSGVLLIVGAAGGLQKLCQETGMAELLGERLLGFPGGLLVPFLVAALMKILQGSSLVAAIAAAGMVQPILAPLGFAGESGKALVTLAVGAGAMTVSHVNDEYFWLVTATAGLTPSRGMAIITAGTLLQGLAALAALLALSAFFSGA